MSLTFPRLMPTVGAMGLSFEPERVDYLSPEAGGRLGAMTAGFPRWTMRISLSAMLPADADVWRAWLAVQRGPARPFYAYDIDRQVPAAYVAGGSFAGTPSGWSQAIDGNGVAVLTLTGLLAGQKVSLNDYIGLAWPSARRALTRAAEPAVANGAGAATFAVEPPIPPVVPLTAAATLVQATCVMRLVTGETKLAEVGLGGIMGAGGTISAAEDFRA
jgi:hypothetical protein